MKTITHMGHTFNRDAVLLLAEAVTNIGEECANQRQFEWAHQFALCAVCLMFLAEMLEE